MNNSWIFHVKQYALQHNVSYKQAMTLAKSSYNQIGGSANSGYIQRIIAEKKPKFEIEKVKQPSQWIQSHFKKNDPYEEEFIKRDSKEMYELVKKFLMEKLRRPNPKLHHTKITHDNILNIMRNNNITARTLLKPEPHIYDPLNELHKQFTKLNANTIYETLKALALKVRKVRLNLPPPQITKPNLIKKMDQYKITRDDIMKAIKK